MTQTWEAILKDRLQLYGHRNEFGERAISLHSESFVELTGIRTSAPARGAPAAAGVRRQRNIRADRKTALTLYNGC